ncbi:MAG: hypothetical protein C4567_01545 [Deltaproteobacteria bacterium]|nr:MAG: hypothetical protein C4567_01545 [Deltaproteobacteria bacterium]
MLHSREDYQQHIQDDRTSMIGNTSAPGGIPQDEPVFLLRAQDAAAADTVRYWGNRVKELGGDLDLVVAALQQADAMDAWPRKKVPDAPPPEA